MYSDAVHYAASQVLLDAAFTKQTQVERLRELLYSLASTIPEAWGTRSRAILIRRDSSIERVVRTLASDLYNNSEPSRYLVLSSVQLLALTIKQMDGRSSSILPS